MSIRRLQTEAQLILEMLDSLGWKHTKANYLRMLLDGTFPEFPLPPEVEAKVPEELPGKLPASADEYYEAVDRVAEDDEEDD